MHMASPKASLQRPLVGTAPLLSVARGVSAVARLSLGPVLPLLSKEFTIDLYLKGQLLSAFSVGYLLTQVGGGWLADRCGASRVVGASLLLTGALLWAVPLVGDGAGVDGLTAVFFLIGFVNGPLFPACNVMLKVVPASARAQASAIVDAGGTLGGCLATAACPLLAAHVGWRRLYDLLAVLSFGFSLLWTALAEEPSSSAGAASVAAGGGAAGAGAARSAGAKDVPQAEDDVGSAFDLFVHTGPWALFWAHSVFNYANYVLNAWMPTMFVERFAGIDAATAGGFLMWPEVAGIASRFGAAAVADRLVREGKASLLTVRRSCSALAFLGQALMLAAAAKQVSPFSCACCLTAASVANGAHAGGYKANYLDLTKVHGGILAGVGNTWASAASAVGPAATAAALARAPGDWKALLAPLLILNLSGALVALRWFSADCLDGSCVAPGDSEAPKGEAASSPRLCCWARRRAKIADAPKKGGHQ